MEYEPISKVFLQQAAYSLNPRPAIYSCGGGAGGETGMCGGRPSNTLPCLTVRDNTERPETITIGTNELIGTDPSKPPPALARLIAGQWKKAAIPPKWDGKAAERIVEHMERLLAGT